jgi:hypothetical protein
MAYILPNPTSNRLSPKLVPMTAYQIYLNQVKTVIEPIRTANVDTNITYIPPQFGGLDGQATLIQESVVLELIDFKVS